MQEVVSKDPFSVNTRYKYWDIFKFSLDNQSQEICVPSAHSAEMGGGGPRCLAAKPMGQLPPCGGFLGPSRPRTVTFCFFPWAGPGAAMGYSLSKSRFPLLGSVGGACECLCSRVAWVSQVPGHRVWTHRPRRSTAFTLLCMPSRSVAPDSLWPLGL